MASFGDDFVHMNVEGASTVHGLAILVEEGCRQHPILSTSFGFAGLEWGAISYARKWGSVTSSDKRDIIAALRTCGKGALIVAKIASML